MNEIGIDSLSLAAYMPLTQAMVDQIAFMIQKSGTSSAGGAQVGTDAYFHQTMSTNQYFEQNVQLMQQNGKPIGAYFFSFAWDYASAKYEAELECDHLNALQHKPDWPVFCDWEAVSRDAVVAAGFPITSQRMLDIFHGWKDGCVGKGYYPGFYSSAAILRDDLGSSNVQTLRNEGMYCWEAHYKVQQPWILPVDVWQYYAGPRDVGDEWMGTVVDWNKVMDDRIWNLGPGPGPGPGPSPSTIPIWLKLKMARSDQNAKCTILL